MLDKQRRLSRGQTSRFELASLALLLATSGCLCSPEVEPADKTDTPAPQPIGPTGIKLVVVLVIDQLPSWTFTRDAGQLEGGIARLLRESVYFPEAAFPYANTYTAPGHATIATGAGPRLTGILANSWNRGRKGTYAAATSDPDSPVYDLANAAGPPFGFVDASGSSPSTQRIDGIADVLAREKPASRSVAIGLKERAVVMMLGKNPTRALWYEASQRGFTTSAHYGKPPAWIVKFNRENPISKRLDDPWQINDPDFLRRYTGVSDDTKGESAGMGIDTTFPHAVSDSPLAPKVFRIMPSSVHYLLDAARAAIAGEQLGLRGQRDLLAVTISTHDYVGHFWGQESWERFDSLRQIDFALAGFFEHLDSLYGPNGYAIALTSDHGGEPLIEHSVAAGRDARRIPIPELTDAVNRAAVSVLGKGEWLSGYGANSIYFSDAFLGKEKRLRRRAIEAVLMSLRQIPNVGLAEETANLVGDCAAHADELKRLTCESVHPEESGDITVVPARYSLFHSPQYTTGTSHGTPSPESRVVPILVRAPGISPFRSLRRVTLYQLAPTVTNLLEVSPPLKDAIPLPLEVDPTDTLPH